MPDSFDSLDRVIRETFEGLLKSGSLVLGPEPAVPKVPIDYTWAHELGLIRKPANFVSSITDDRGQELLYAGMPITDVFKDDIGLGGVISLLWCVRAAFQARREGCAFGSPSSPPWSRFQRRLPAYATKFMEMCLMVTADHGPAVSGAHNTIVTARAGKDLVSSLCSGLLTIVRGAPGHGAYHVIGVWMPCWGCCFAHGGAWGRCLGGSIWRGA